MAFTTRRGRPSRPAAERTDPGTPELRFKHALGLTIEPIDLCLNKNLITPSQHWCGLHLRWLYTMRYGAPNLTTHYSEKTSGPRTDDDSPWRSCREAEYQAATTLLHRHRCYEPVMRLCVHNELPIFANPALHQQAWEKPALAGKLRDAHLQLMEGLDLLAQLWKHRRPV